MCVGIIFISYALQVKYRPFLDPNPDAARDARLAVIPGAELVYVRTRGCAPHNRPALVTHPLNAWSGELRHRISADRPILA